MSTLIENVDKVVAAHKAIKNALADKGIDVRHYSKLTQAEQKIKSIKELRIDENGIYAVYEYIEA